MEKWCDYAISSIKKTNDVITEVQLLKEDGDSFIPVGVKTVEKVIEMIDNGSKIITVMWMYPDWAKGAEVTVVDGSFKRFIRTERDKTAKDNLENLTLIL